MIPIQNPLLFHVKRIRYNAISIFYERDPSHFQCYVPAIHTPLLFHLRLRINYTYIPQLYPYSILLIVHAVSLYRSVTIHVTDSYAMPMLFMYSSAVIMV